MLSELLTITWKSYLKFDISPIVPLGPSLHILMCCMMQKGDRQVWSLQIKGITNSYNAYQLWLSITLKCSFQKFIHLFPKAALNINSSIIMQWKPLELTPSPTSRMDVMSQRVSVLWVSSMPFCSLINSFSVDWQQRTLFNPALYKVRSDITSILKVE